MIMMFTVAAALLVALVVAVALRPRLLTQLDEAVNGRNLLSNLLRMLLVREILLRHADF